MARQPIEPGRPVSTGTGAMPPSGAARHRPFSWEIVQHERDDVAVAAAQLVLSREPTPSTNRWLIAEQPPSPHPQLPPARPVFEGGSSCRRIEQTHFGLPSVLFFRFHLLDTCWPLGRETAPLPLASRQRRFPKLRQSGVLSRFLPGTFDKRDRTASVRSRTGLRKSSLA